ncbi:MAG: tRNA (N6-threonylcarbamoyladenosine(37)-N6)-methyltransferase TrmO [Oscillospiraceae bacterium]|nr:tRNA (N6-threonylcarbamoyladenosine(37)-N6)-methyltransferase TrmO [Oscillospiraceae bacterium]
MSDEIIMRPVGHIESDFQSKFGIPRQAGLVPELRARVVFEPEFRSPEAVRELESFSHIWLLWLFSAAIKEGARFSPTVRPPRLGGNRRVGVFASRSPFRPNAIGLSCVELLAVEPDTPAGPVLTVAGADLMDGTPILDIKPYIPYADCRPEAAAGFTAAPARRVACVIPPALLQRLPEDKREALRGVLEADPRPSYQDDPERVYGFGFAGREVRFRVADGVLTVVDII